MAHPSPTKELGMVTRFIETESAVGVASQFVLGRIFISYKIKRRIVDIFSLITELSKVVQVPHEDWYMYSYVSLAEMAAIIGMQPTYNCGLKHLGLLDITRTNHILVSNRQDTIVPQHVHYTITYYNEGNALISNNNDMGGYGLDVEQRFVCGWGRFNY